MLNSVSFAFYYFKFELGNANIPILQQNYHNCIKFHMLCFINRNNHAYKFETTVHDKETCKCMKPCGFS